MDGDVLDAGLNSAVIESQIHELVGDLRATRKKRRWHYTWLLLGISPGAVIPAMGLLAEGSLGLLVSFLVLVAFWQIYLGAKASSKMDELEARIEGLKSQLRTELESESLRALPEGEG